MQSSKNPAERVELITNQIAQIKSDILNKNNNLETKTKLSNNLIYLEIDLLRLTNKDYSEKYDNALWSESSPRG